MNLPGFTAERSLGKLSHTYHGKYLYGELSHGQSGVPAIVLPTQLGDTGLLENAEETNLIEEPGLEYIDEEPEAPPEGEVAGLMEEGEAPEELEQQEEPGNENSA